MNNSVYERYSLDRDDDDLVEVGLKLLPTIGRTLYSAIAEIGHAHGLTVSQMKAILHLSSGNQTTVGEVATALGVSMPSASELVDRLVEAGHVVRSPDPTDRRRVQIAATPGAAQIGEQLRDFRRQQLRLALSLLPPEERPMFVRSLEALVAALRETSPFDYSGLEASREPALSPARSGKD
jgi:DNA-binding MarR family transcriptional regulator